MSFMVIKSQRAGFHAAGLGYFIGQTGATAPKPEKRYRTMYELDVSYLISPHFHPYTAQLVQRLLARSVTGLQAADTDYMPSGALLPGSIDVAIATGMTLNLPAGSRIIISTDTDVDLSGGRQLRLSPGLELKTSGVAAVTLTEGLQLTLAEGMTAPPADRTFGLPQDFSSATIEDVRVTLRDATALLFFDGETPTVPAGTVVALPRGTRLGLPAGLVVTMLKSRPRPKLYEEIFSSTRYKPTDAVQLPYPAKDLDFRSGGAYAIYNWELFYHVPFTIAVHLSKNQRFAEAMQWLHYIFDPTDDSDGPTPERFWKFRPFQDADVKKIEAVMVNLATGADYRLQQETITSIEAWRDAPFRPHVVARYRQQAYMYRTVMAYLDNLIAWGDSLFRQDTGESIDEALMLYVLAANILGPRPQPVPAKGSVRPQTYANLRTDLDRFGNAMRDVEAEIGFDLLPFPAEETTDDARIATIRSLGKALYFCVPVNDKLLGYWDTVADRLFKIRNSLNIQGTFRQLPLFEPPIDPAMLARAAAAGLDVGAIVAGLNQPLPLVRFRFLIQKANEVCQEVKSLGGALLSALEKEDGETLAVLRAKHERIVLEMVEHIRYAQWQEAIKAREGVQKSLALAVQRYTYYERQLGVAQSDIEKAMPELEALDKAALDAMKLSVGEGELKRREIAPDIAHDLNVTGGKIISSHELRELEALAAARNIQDVVQGIRLGGQAISLLPQFGIKLHFWGLGGDATFGGENLAKIAQFAADIAAAVGERHTYEAGNASRIGIYARREQDWALQSNLAAGEIEQIYKQLRAAEIREAVAEKELANHRLQIKHAKDVEHFLNEEGANRKGKVTGKAFYTWMKREVKGLYAQSFQLAFDVAKRAERALQHELGDQSRTYLQFGYLSGKEGLLAGEKLQFDIKRMELAYHDLNRREYELTKHVSLAQIAPLALLQLRATGRCTVSVPEELFDMDGPGHYFRRIKSVAVSIPCVAGPYASVNCTLTLLKSRIRVSPVVNGGYMWANADDSRFDEYRGSLDAIVTSSGQNDSGLFETSLQDERYLPFENAGAISEWQLQLPANPSAGEPMQFDYDSISDVILHIRYTAREAGGLLRQSAMANMKTLIETGTAAGSVRLFSLRHEFPTEWDRFRHHPPPAGERAVLKVKFGPQHFPFWGNGLLKNFKQIDVIAEAADHTLDVADRADLADVATKKDTLVKDEAYGDLLIGALENIPLPAIAPNWTDVELALYFERQAIDDLWLAVRWGS
jgi:hypothetical protein